MQIDIEFKEKSLEKVSKWGQENKERRLKADAERRRKKYQTDLGYRVKQLRSAASYRSQRLKAQPTWLSDKHLKEIENIYLVAAKVAERSGKPHDVDHVVPLKGKNVCGLHVPWNLAIVPASLNRSKGNSYTYPFTFS